MDFGGGQYEDNLGWGLFQCFEQGVGGAVAEHMDFVYDIDLVASLRGGVVDLFAQAADIIDASVAGGVDFNDIHGAALGYGSAHIAFVAGFFFIGAEAVDRFSQDAAGAGLARSPGAVEKIGVGDALALDGITESLGYRCLTDYIG